MLPVFCSMASSASKNGTLIRWARSRPTELLPAPMKPTSAISKTLATGVRTARGNPLPVAIDGLSEVVQRVASEHLEHRVAET